MSGRSSIIKISKRSKGFRAIYVPDEGYRTELAWCKTELEKILLQHAPKCRDHAFVRHRNCATNAEIHLGRKFLLTLDLEDFFDSLSATHLRQYLDDELLFWVLEDGAPRQGLPTSPVAANIAMIEPDRRISQLCEALGVTYSRYADDLTFGFDDPSLCSVVEGGVISVLNDFDLRVSHRKTRFQNSKNGNMLVTGVAITATGVIASRKTRRRLRAALHQNNKPQARGLEEWARCRFPKQVSAKQDK